VKKTQKTKEKDKKPVQSKSHNEIGKDAGWDDISLIRETTKTRCDGW
jgi:hypothetical protein